MASEPQWIADTQKIADAVMHDHSVRLLPIIGNGTIQTVADLTHLDSVDAAILPLDTLTYAQAQGLLKSSDKVSYLVQLQQVTWVLVASPKNKTLTALAGKRIATGPTGTSGFVAGELIFNAFEVPFERVPKVGADALAAVATGEADAALVDAVQIRKFKLNAGQFHCLPLTVPTQLDSTYHQTEVSQRDLPGLIAEDQKVDAVKTPLALMVSGNKASSSASFKVLTEVVLAHAKELGFSQDITADIQGWQRHDQARKALSAFAEKQTKGSASSTGDGQ
ncbi:MAG: hypothetical protein U1E15_11825 [Hyphomicrobiales bacterium]